LGMLFLVVDISSGHRDLPASTLIGLIFPGGPELGHWTPVTEFLDVRSSCWAPIRSSGDSSIKLYALRTAGFELGHWTPVAEFSYVHSLCWALLRAGGPGLGHWTPVAELSDVRSSYGVLAVSRAPKLPLVMPAGKLMALQPFV